MGELKEISVGDSMPERVVPKVVVSDFVKYAGAGGDFNPIHHDPSFAALAGQDSVFAMGMWQAGVVSVAAAEWLGPENVRRFKCRFRERVWPGDKLVCAGEVVAIREEGGERLADLELKVSRGEGQIAVEAEATFAIR